MMRLPCVKTGWGRGARDTALWVAWAVLGAGVAWGQAPVASFQERQCQAHGWVRELVPVAGLRRVVLWKAPAQWTRGAIVVLHGGGGAHTNFCVANARLIEPQVRFTEMALAQGFAVFLLNSSDQVRDNASRLCGKIWDDEVRARANLDLPFIGEVLRRVIPEKRPAQGRPEIFLTGHSSGGYMTVRAASHWSALIAAFAPVASGDPYGWQRDCTPLPGGRANVFGAGFDRDTGRQIIEPGACLAPAYPNELPWDDAGVARPVFRLFHHAQDGINDASCGDRVRRQLLAHGYPEVPPFVPTAGTRQKTLHYWQDEYNAPLLQFFASRVPLR